MTTTSLVSGDFLGSGTANTLQMAIATREGEGALWYGRRAVRIYPKWELQTTIRIPDDGCWDLFNEHWAFDGYTTVLTKTKPPYLGAGGGYIGYSNIYDALVIEVDLYYNSEFGDLSANALSIHRCYGKNCGPSEGADTVQRQLPINYDKCSVMRYTLNIQYTPGYLNIYWGNGALLVQTNEDFFSKFKGWAYLGFTGFFRGSKKRLFMENSYFCEDTLSSNMDIQWAGTSGSSTITAVAGGTMTLLIQFKDPSGLFVPHFKDLGLIDWSITVESTCGDERVATPYSAFQLAFEVFGCEKSGTYQVKMSFGSTQIQDAYLPKFSIVARAFEKSTLSLSSTKALKSISNELFLVQSDNDSFPLDLLPNKIISFNILVTDVFNNHFSLPASSFVSELALTCIKVSDGTPAAITITNSDNFKLFTVELKILSPGKYRVTGNKLTTFFIQVNAGQPSESTSFCQITTTISNTSPVFPGSEVQYACYLNDRDKNPLTVDDAEKTYKTVFSCNVTRNYNSKSTTVPATIVPNDKRTGYICKFTPTAQGTYAFGAQFKIVNTVSIPSSSNSFTTYSPVNFANMNYFDYTQQLWIKYDPAAIVNLVFSPQSDSLLKLDFLDVDGRSVGINGIGFPPNFDHTQFSGQIWSEHDNINIAKKDLSFSRASNQVVSVFISNASTYFVKTSYAFTLAIAYAGKTYKFNFYTKLTNNGNRVVCSHDMDPSKTLFESTGVTNLQVNQDTVLANISLRTSDSNLYNYFVDKNKAFTIDFTPKDNFANPNFDIIPSTIDGTYQLKVNSIRAGVFTVTITVKNVNEKFYKDFQFSQSVNVLADPNVGTISQAVPSQFKDAANNILADKTNDDNNVIDVIFKDVYENTLNIAPSAANNFLGITISLNINKKSYNVKWDSSTVNIVYNGSNYQIIDNYKVAGSYVLTLTTKKGVSFVIQYDKQPGLVSTSKSTVTFSSNPTINVMETSEITLNLLDNYGENLMNGSKDIKSKALDLIKVMIEGSGVAFERPTESGYIFVSKSAAINTAGKFNILVTYNDKKILCTTNCVQTVSYPTIDFQKTVVNLISGGVITLNKDTAQKINNKSQDLLLNFFFYNSSGKQLNNINPDLYKQINCRIYKDTLFDKALIASTVNNAYIYYSFEPNSKDYTDYQNAVFGNYFLNCVYTANNNEKLSYPLILLGEGQEDDAGNGDIVINNTVLSTTNLFNTAGVDGTFNLEFRTAENKRYNQFDDNYAKNFVFEVSIPDDDVKKFKIEKGQRKGTYIFSVNSKLAHYSPSQVVITITYKGAAIPTKLNFFNTHNDLTSLKLVDGQLAQPNTNKLKDGTTVASFDLFIQAFDKFGNFFLQIFDTKIWSINRIQRLLAMTHSNSQAIVDVSVIPDPNSNKINFRMASTVVGRIDIASSFLDQSYSLILNPGPVSTKSYASVITSSVIAGGNAQVKVFPLDQYSNIIPLARLTDAEKAKFKITVNQPVIGAADVPYLSQDATENSLLFQIKLTKIGINTYMPGFNSNIIPCSNCQTSVSIAAITYTNSALYQQSGDSLVFQNIKEPVSVKEKTTPSFNFYLHDEFMNRYPEMPKDLTFDVTWKNSVKSFKLTTTRVNDALVITIGKEIRREFIYLLVGSYTLTIVKTNKDQQTEKLDYTVALVGDPPDPNASNDDMDPSQTFVSRTSISTTAGQIEVFMLEVRTKEGKRRNFLFEEPEKDIILSFAFDNGNKDIYKTSIVPAEKFGQYYIQISSTKVYLPSSNNYIKVQIEGKDCPKVQIALVVSASNPDHGYYVDSAGKQYSTSMALPVGNADDSYSFKLVLEDVYHNVCTLTAGDLNYKIEVPQGKTCNACSSTVSVNPDSTFTVTYTPKTTGTYKITSSFITNAVFTFDVNPGKPHSGNSRANVIATSVAGKPVDVWIFPYDKNNNFINPNTFEYAKTFNSFYKYSENGVFTNYLEIKNPVVAETTYNTNKVSAVKFTTTLTKRDKNFFRITLGTTTEISCDNCITTVSPSDPDFKSFLVQRYDADLGTFVTINGQFDEKFQKSMPFYNLYPRDQYLNLIDTVTNVGDFSASITDGKTVVKFIVGNKPGEVDSVKIRNQDGDKVLNPTLYEDLVAGTYTLTFSKKDVTDTISYKVRLVGSTDDSDASNNDFDIKYTSIKEQNLAFTAGGSGYFIVEMRTTENTRRNEWGFTITPVPSIENSSFAYKVNQAGKKGQYYVAIFTNLSNNYPQLTPYKIDVYITAPGKTDKVKSPVTLDMKIDPEVLVTSEIATTYLKSNSANLLDGNADKPVVFNIVGYDKFRNQAAPTEALVKLTVIDSLKAQVTYKTGIDVLKGQITVEFTAKTAGLYSLTSPTFVDSKNNKVNYSYQNAPGAINHGLVIISDISSEVQAGGLAKLRITPRDQYSNYIDDVESIKLYSASVTTLSNKVVDINSGGSAAIENKGFNSLLIQIPLTEKGISSWSVNYQKTRIECKNCQTLVKPDVAVLEKSIISITNNAGQYVVTPNNGQSSNNNAILFTIQAKLKDKYENPLDTVDSLAIDKCSVVLQGNYMVPISFLKVKNGDQVVFSMDKAGEAIYNKLVSGSNYEVIITLASSTASYTHKIQETITSNWKDDDYGNGDYVVAKTVLSLQQFDLNANAVQTFTMTLYTEQGKIYNNDIDISDINVKDKPRKDFDYEVNPTPTDNSFFLNINKASSLPGVYSIDVKVTKITALDAKSTLKLKLRPIKNTVDKKEYLKDITYVIKPAVPPDPEQTKIEPIPEKTNSGEKVKLVFTLFDKFGNIYSKNTAIRDNLIVLNGDQPVNNVNKNLVEDTKYVFDFTPSYPPRQLNLKVVYVDSAGTNQNIHKNILSTFIVSKPVWKNTVVSGSNIQRMKAGEKLDLNLYLKDINGQCVDTSETIVMSAQVTGPLEAGLNDKKYDNTYNFELKKKDPASTADCNNYYAIKIADENNYVSVGTYRISVKISNENVDIGQYNQIVSPNVIDITKFVSVWINKGDFNPGKVVAGTFMGFEIQAYDSFNNKITEPIPESLNCTVVYSDFKPLEDNNYKLDVAQNTNGKINGVVRIFKTGNFNFQYFYKKLILPTINNSQGPFQVSIIPTGCSERWPNLDMSKVASVSPGQSTSFQINCLDEYKNAISTGGELFDININVVVEPTLVSTNIKSTFTDLNNGSYKVEFTPLYPGTYSIGIVLKSTGVLYGNMNSFQIKASVCPDDKPIRCANDQTKCVKNSIECVDNNPCAGTPTTPISCKVGGQLKCVRSQSVCDCPDNYIRCDVGSACVPQDKDYLCPFNLELNCPKQFPGKPYFCPDGICRATKDDCPAQRVCPYGYTLCPDLSCQKDKSQCNSYEDCAGNLIKCPDQTCVANQKDCPSIITCSKPGQLVCPDGRCVDTDLDCAPVPVCNAPNNILCPSNTCSNSISNCPKSISCGQGKSLCSDINCKDSCLQ